MQHQRKLAQPQKDGATYRDHMQAAAHRSPFARAELAGPGLPPELAYIWAWFLEMHGARTWTESGPNPLTFAEIAAWASLTHTRIASWEVAVLRSVDLAWITKPDGVHRHSKA